METEEKPTPKDEESKEPEQEKEADEPPKEGEESAGADAAAPASGGAGDDNPEAAEAGAEGAADRGKRVYVGNLAWQVSWQDLKDHMKTTGLEVTRANIITAPDGRSKGCGIVEFATAKDAAQAVATLNDSELKGRQIFVREDREDRPTFVASGGRFTSGEQAQGRRVYVGNLSWDVAWQDLKDHMKQAGEVVHAEIISDQHSGRSKGCGVVEFASEEDAQNAIETLSNTELKGRSIFVREDRESTSKPPQAGPRSANPSVYIWNLSPETSWQDLKDHMRRAGNVDSASVFVSPSGETCSGIVVYQRPQDAARAIRELQGTELHGMAMSLREDRMHSGGGHGGGRGGSRGRGGRGYSGGRGYGGGGRGGDRFDPALQVFVGNLSYDTTWRELKDHFRQCGDVKRAEVKTSGSGESRGFGTVQFYKKEDAEAAISRLNGSELQGREIEVRADQKAR